MGTWIPRLRSFAQKHWHKQVTGTCSHITWLIKTRSCYQYRHYSAGTVEISTNGFKHKNERIYPCPP